MLWSVEQHRVLVRQEMEIAFECRHRRVPRHFHHLHLIQLPAFAQLTCGFMAEVVKS